MESPLSLHRSRQRLIMELSDRIEENHRHQIALVFDAKNPKGLTTPELNSQGFKIAFAANYEDADAMVIEMIRVHSQPRQLTVVSGDHRIQTAATRRDAKAIDADVWFDQLQLLSEREDLVNELEKPDVTLSSSETRRLIEEFSKPSDTTDNASTIQPDSEKADDKESESFYNPFPDGYGEDLLE